MADDPTKLPAIRAAGELAAQTARDRLLDAFNQCGVTEELLAMVGADLLQATKQQVKWDKGSKAVFDSDGNVVKEGSPPGFKYSKHMSDNTTRYNSLKLLMEFHDAMPSKKIDIEDKRQTRDLANALFEKMEKMGQLGADEKQLPAGGADPVEMELMEDMYVGGADVSSAVAGAGESGSIRTGEDSLLLTKQRYVDLVPTDD